LGGYQGIPKNVTGIAQKLKNAGYATHMVGKWHCGLVRYGHWPALRSLAEASWP
jgi:arylsulfatase B